MKKSPQRFIVIFILFVMLACNLPLATTITPTVVPEGVSQIPSTVPEVQEQVLPPSDLTELYTQKVDSGEWSEGEGIIVLLQLAIGIPSVSIDIPSSVDSLELTGIVRLARAYLENGSDENSKTEIKNLLEIFLPTQESLDAFSIPESEAFQGSAKLAALKLQETNCSTLWREGFIGAPYPCLMFGQRTIGGKDYRIYFPLEWRGDATKIAVYQSTFDIIEQVSSVYSAYGTVPAMYIVFRWDLDETDPTGGIASATGGGPSSACPVFIRPPAFSLEPNIYKQAIAHEMFHCFQDENIINYRPYTYDSTAWFLEGTAEYFSNLAYPEVDYEYRNMQKLNERSLVRPLYQMSYGNFLFFQHMANQSGPEKIIEMMKSMPINGSLQDQLNAIVAYPGMIDLFESYTRQFLANQIADTSGIIYPYSPLFGQVNLITDTLTGEIKHNAFVLYREKFIYDQTGKEFTFTSSASRATVRIGTAPIDFPSWQIPTWVVNTTCNRWEYMTYSIGVSNNMSGQLASYAINAADVPIDTPCEQCLVGTWKLDPASYIIYANSLFPRSMNIATAVGWNGDMFMEYTAEGKAAATYTNFMVFYKGSFPDPNGGRPIQSNLEMKFIATSAVGYTADASTITYTGGRGRIEAKGNLLLPDGTTSPISVNPSAFASGGTPLVENYACKGDYLSVIPIMPPSVPNIPEPIFFTRFAPPSP